MSQPIRMSSLLAAPAATFEQPFEMLQACHERVERMLALLARLREHLPVHGADAQARQAARDVMRYFDLAAPQHHRDEELHVFPPLLRDGPPALRAAVQRLQADHLRMESGWAAAREVLQAVADGAVAAPSAAQARALDDFAGLYAGHIASEEQLVYPAARERLDEAALAAMGAEMMRRRGAA